MERKEYKILEKVIKNGKEYELKIAIDGFDYEEDEYTEYVDVRYILFSKIQIDYDTYDLKIILNGEYDDDDILRIYRIDYFVKYDYIEVEVEVLKDKIEKLKEFQQNIDDLLKKYLFDIEEFLKD